MSLSESQREEVRKLVHTEIKKILDAGLMMTEEADMQASQPKSNPQQKQTTQAPLQTINPESAQWEIMPPSTKGVWEKTTDLTPDTEIIKAKLEEAKKPLFIEGALYWLVHNRESGAYEGLGRRVKL